MAKQEMDLHSTPRASVPQWGRRIRLERFSVELVPAGERSFNVKLPKTLATISFSADEGVSSLAGDRLRRYDRRPYEYLVVPANFPLRGESRAAPEVLAFAFRFEDLKADVAAAMQVTLDRLEPRVIIGSPKPFATELAKRIRRHLRADTISRDYLHALGTALIVEMLRLPPRQQETGRGTKLDDRVLRSIVEYVDANLEANLSLERLASLAGVLTPLFGRAFKRKVGAPPHQYVLARRIEAARSLLCSTESSIAEIAHATGFSSQSHLTATLRREVGVTPARLRSECRK
ncbi:MAG: AraC family transcriptional regulator [Pseudomonadota bacterium]